jgi:hypothetical protein
MKFPTVKIVGNPGPNMFMVTGIEIHNSEMEFEIFKHI